MRGIKQLLVGAPFFVLQAILCFIGFHNDSQTTFKVAVGLIFIYCIIEGGKQKYIINPYYLLVLTPISLLIYLNIGNKFFIDLTKDTWLLIICNIDALLIGLGYTKPTRNHERKLNKIYAQRLYTVTAWIFTILGSIPPIIYRFTGTVIPVAYIITMLGVAGVMAGMATKKRKLIVPIIIIYVFPILLGGASKTGVLTLLIALLISYEKFYVNDNDIKSLMKIRKHILVGCVIAIPIMISAFTFANKERGSYDANENYEYYRSNVEWNFDAAYFMPYMYITTPWANLQYVTETQDNRSYGYWLTKPILGPIFGDKLLKDNYVPQSYSSFNTFSFIGLHFKDFGYWGSLLISLFLGFFIKKVYSLYAFSTLPYDAASYVFSAQATLELFFSNHFFGQSYPFMIVLVMYLFKKLTKI